jgi:hypothetical protein
MAVARLRIVGRSPDMTRRFLADDQHRELAPSFPSDVEIAFPHPDLAILEIMEGRGEEHAQGRWHDEPWWW